MVLLYIVYEDLQFGYVKGRRLGEVKRLVAFAVFGLRYSPGVDSIPASLATANWFRFNYANVPIALAPALFLKRLMLY